jgi:hypothetical protein
MTSPIHRSLARLAPLSAALSAAALLTACIVQPLPPQRYVQPAPQPVPVYDPPPSYVNEDDTVVSAYVEPPLDQPEPIAVAWAPPPMLVEAPPPPPFVEAIWIGGFWTWEGRWIWAAGRWAPPPRPNFYWVQPYYEHRGEVVVFVPGFWCPPERRFIPPPPGRRIAQAIAGPGLRGGRPPIGPQGVFVPPPPGSRHGLIVPAPVGTPPAVVVSAPPLVNSGMRVRGNGDFDGRNGNRGGNVTIDAPPGSTANGQAWQGSVPARANLAAGLAPAGRPAAPRPVNAQPIPSFVPGRAPAALPPAQPIRNDRNDRNDRDDRNDRNDRGNAQNPGRPGQAQAPQGWPQQGQQPQQVQSPQQAQQAPQPGFQGRPGLQQPGLQPPQSSPQAQPLPPQGDPQRGQPGQYPGRGQAQQPQQPQQPQGQVQQPAQGQGQPQPNPQDPRTRGDRGGNQPGAQGNRQPGQPGQPAPSGAQQGGQQPQAQGQPQQAQPAQRRDEKDARERKTTPRERKDDRDKKDGERDR